MLAMLIREGSGVAAAAAAPSTDARLNHIDACVVAGLAITAVAPHVGIRPNCK